MKKLLRDFFALCFDFMNAYPILSASFILMICLYLMFVTLPDAFNKKRKEIGLYAYYSRAGLVLSLIFVLICFFIVLLTKIF